MVLLTAGARDLSLLQSVQTVSGAGSSSYLVGTGIPSSEQRGRGVKVITLPT
jgi:hypothetical protein